MPAYRFIIVLFSQHHQFIIIRQTMGMMGQIPATDTDRMYFRHIFGHSHQIRHRPERFTGIIHIQPSDYYADTVICQCFTYRHYIRIKKLGFIDSDDIDITKYYPNFPPAYNESYSRHAIPHLHPNNAHRFSV